MGSGLGKKSTSKEAMDKRLGYSRESLYVYDDQQQQPRRANAMAHVRIKVKGPSLPDLLNICPQPPYVKDMENLSTNNCILMIKPFKYNPFKPDEELKPIHHRNRYVDQWDEQHVRMPCSPMYTSKNGQPRWPSIRQSLLQLKLKCDNQTATVDTLKRTIESCTERYSNIDCLEHLINEVYSTDERACFMSTVLSNICSLAINVEIICSEPPPLLRIHSNRSVTMSQRQAAALLACAFFGLFPYRSDAKMKKEYQYFPNPNFNTLYERGHIEKVEKLRCILHYFERIAEQMPNGAITIRRRLVPKSAWPTWWKSNNGLVPMHLTTSMKIEDIDNVLQVDFANKYIGGGVLTSGCVQEEIHFVLCPEMLVSLLVCEMMEANECIYLIGCERYSSYRGYATTFQYAGEYIDLKPKDNWARKWSHLVAIDALYFRDRSTQYQMKYIKRDSIKAYTGFYSPGQNPNSSFPIATGNWGCGAFNGDRQLKAIIQLMAASQAVRPLIYAAYGDQNLMETFSIVYNYLLAEGATVRDLYRYLERYSRGNARSSLFDFILQTSVASLRS